MVGVIVCVVVILLVLFLPRLSGDKCPECKGRMIEEMYDMSLGKTVYRCTKCGQLFVTL